MSLAANLPLFPRLAQQTLCEIEPLLCFCLLLLEVLDTTFQCLEPRGEVGRWGFWTTGPQTSDLDDRESSGPYDCYECDKKHSRFHVVFPKRLLGHCPALIALLPSERVTRTVQDLSAPSANRHDRRQDRGVELVTRQSGEEATVDGDRPYLRVVTTEVDILGTDLGLNAGYGRLSKGDQSLRTEAETGELETIYRKGIAWNVVPFGVCLQRRLARLRDRWRQTLFRSRGPGRARSEHEEQCTSEA